MVNSSLKAWGETIEPWGPQSWSRMIRAMIPAR